MANQDPWFAMGRHLAGEIDAGTFEWRWDKDGQLSTFDRNCGLPSTFDYVPKADNTKWLRVFYSLKWVRYFILINTYICGQTNKRKVSRP